MFPLIRSTGSKKQSKLAAHAPFSYRLTAPISIPSNNSSQDSNRSYAKRRRALLSSFGEQSPLFSKGFPKKNAKLISQTRATPNLIEKCSRARMTAAGSRWGSQISGAVSARTFGLTAKSQPPEPSRSFGIVVRGGLSPDRTEVPLVFGIAP